MLVTTAYKSKLVSLLSFPILEDPPKTFKKLAIAEPHEYKITLQYLRGAAFSLLKTSTNPTFQTIFKRMSLEEDAAKCFQNAIGTTHHVCISWDTIAEYAYNKNLSDRYGNVPLTKAPDTSCFIAIGLVFEKRAVFKQKFDVVLSIAASMGLTEKWVQLDHEIVREERSEWERETNRTKPVYPAVQFIKALKRENLEGAFYVIFCGLLVALVGYFGEIASIFVIKIQNSLGLYCLILYLTKNLF